MYQTLTACRRLPAAGQTPTSTRPARRCRSTRRGFGARARVPSERPERLGRAYPARVSRESVPCPASREEADPARSWACRSWVRCACPAASPDARNGWYFVYTSNGQVCIFFASITELSRKVSIARPSKPPFSRLELTISRLSQRLMRLMLGKNTFSRPFDAYYRVPSRLGCEGAPTCAHLATIR